MKDNREALDRERVGRLVLTFSIPSVAGMLVNGLYNVMDRIFVGRGVGPEALAGVAVVFPLILIVQAFSMLIGHGASSVISLRLGEGRRDKAEEVVGAGTSLALIVGALVVVITALFMQPILVFFGGTATTLGYAMRFTSVLLPGLFLQVMAFTLNNMIRGQGNPVTALLTMVISAGVNCILNPIFIFGLRLGIAGSALATDIAQAVVVVWLLAIYLRTNTGLRLHVPALSFRARVAADILSVGAAPCVMQLMTGVTLILANNVVGAYGGDTGIAVLGIASSLVNLMLMPIMGIRTGVQPIIGYNYGANAYGRVRSALRISLVATVAVCTVAYGLFFLFSREIVSLFVKNAPAIVHIGVSGLRIFLSSIPVVGIAIVGSVYFQAVKKSATALLINVVRQLIVLVPLFLVLPRFLGLQGVWLAGPVADLASVLLALALLAPEMRRLARGSLETVLAQTEPAGMAASAPARAPIGENAASEG
jgi:putative MATE family efflux protein